MAFGHVPDRGGGERILGDDQCFGVAMPQEVRRDDMLAFEHAFAGLAALA